MTIFTTRILSEVKNFLEVRKILKQNVNESRLLCSDHRYETDSNHKTLSHKEQDMYKTYKNLSLGNRRLS
ncbi:hypothetical protein IQC45_20195 [Leptospira interrogans serovar Pomona]|nr:hypothetical protein [Leptospira interrogans serovar Pomona]